MLAILGSGEFALDVADIAAALGLEHCLVGPEDDAVWAENKRAFLALGIGNPLIKERVVSKYGEYRNWVTLVHPLASVSRSAVIEQGAIVTANATVCAKARLGKFATVCWGASVGHGATVGKFTSVLPSATLGGGVSVGDTALVGAGSNLYPRIRVGNLAKVGMGAVVLESLSDRQVAMADGARIFSP